MNLALAQAQLDLITIRESLKPQLLEDSAHWITLNASEEHGGSKVLINGNGEIVGGAGGKLDGKKLEGVKNKSPDVEEHINLAGRIAEAGAKKHGGNAADYTKESSRLAREYKSTQELLGEHGKAKEAFNPDGMGKVSKVKTAKGTEIETRFRIVDADSLIASHDRQGNANPKFPQELQPRDRSKQTSQAWVQKTSKNLDVDSLGKTRRADSGAPIIGEDGVVESGNGRSMAIMEAYTNGHADEYREWLESEAAEFGIDPETIKGMKNPVLVRQRTSDIDRATFTKEANEDDKLAMTATEKARSDAAKLDPGLISRMSEDGDLTAASNRDFINGFIKTLSDSEAAQYFTTGGQLTKQVYDRVQSAVFAKAYNNDRLLELMADDSKPEIKNIISALNSAAGQFIQAKAISEEHHKHISDTLTDGIHVSLDKQAINTLIDAASAIMESKNKGLSLEDYLSQTDVFGDGISPETAAMALFIKDNNRSPARLSVAFKEMASFVNKELERDETESLFGDDEPISLIDVLKAANNAVQKQYGKKDEGKPQRTGGFIDLFTTTRGQEQDRQEWLLKNDSQTDDDNGDELNPLGDFDEWTDDSGDDFGLFDDSLEKKFPKIEGVNIAGIPITIENPEHSVRSGKDKDGAPWSITMKDNYGFIDDTVGADNSEIDIFIKPGTQSNFDGNVYIVKQIEPSTGDFDEDKVMLGYDSEEEAKVAYMRNYAEDWQGFGDMVEFTLDEFKDAISGGELHNDATDEKKHWITTEEGSHLLIGGDGTVLAGAGGKLNGQKLDGVKSKSGDVSEHVRKTEDWAKHGAKTFGGSEAEYLRESSKLARSESAPEEPVTVRETGESKGFAIPNNPDDLNKKPPLYRKAIAGEISIADFGYSLGLTEDQMDDALILNSIGKASTPYSDLMNEVRAEIESRKHAIKKPTNNTASAHKQYNQAIAKWNQELETLSAAGREFLSPFDQKVALSRNYKSLSPILVKMFEKRFESVSTGDRARSDKYKAEAKIKADALISVKNSLNEDKPTNNLTESQESQ